MKLRNVNLHLPCTQGFTLVEMAMVLAIVALLMTGLIPTITSQIEQQQLKETRDQLREIEEALIGFALINGRLPCPATAASKGVESFDAGGNATNGDCSNPHNGFVPVATLGMSTRNEDGLALDAWNNPIHYAVTEANSFAYTKSNGMASTGLDALAPNLLVCSTATGISNTDCGSADYKLTAGDGVPVVIYSTGKNWATGGTGIDETANPNPNSADNNRTFVSHTPTVSTSTNGEFDDIVIWVSNSTLLNRMVSAGKLP